MSDKKELPQFVEDWIAQTTVTMQLNPKYSGVLEEDLRAFLAQYVLCEREPVGYICYGDPDGYTAFSWDNVKCDCGGERNPLHAPATEVPK